MGSYDLWSFWNMSFFPSLSDQGIVEMCSGCLHAGLLNISIFFPSSRPKVEVIVPYCTVMPSFWDTTTQAW